MGHQVYESYHNSFSYKARIGYRNKPNQAGRYTSNVAYTDVQGLSMLKGTTASWARLSPNHYAFTSTYVSPHDYNRAYGRLVEKLGSQSEMLTAGVEWKKSLLMISRRVDQLRRAYQAVRILDVKGAGKILAMSPNDIAKANRRSQKLATPFEIWLELWMGWLPAIGDIQNATKVIEGELPMTKIRGSSRSDKRLMIKNYEPNARATVNYYTDDIHVRTKYGLYATCIVTNHNLWLATQLGLTNPFLTGYQVLPFSFMLNWFVNLEQFLGSLTDFAGVDLLNTGEGLFREVVNGRRYGGESVYSGHGYVYYYNTFECVLTGYNKQRSPRAITRPTLTLQFDKLSLSRAATSVSLLIEVFKPGFRSGIARVIK